MGKILSKLTKGESLILDGGTGSELHRRGINVSKGIRDSGLIGSWSATALIDAPDIVQQVHEDYLSGMELALDSLPKLRGFIKNALK